jgi:hypothetical protein
LGKGRLPLFFFVPPPDAAAAAAAAAAVIMTRTPSAALSPGERDARGRHSPDFLTAHKERNNVNAIAVARGCVLGFAKVFV